nr:MAG TPA_asm: hypothetical protein [Bacteriophage sp.]
MRTRVGLLSFLGGTYMDSRTGSKCMQCSQSKDTKHINNI